MAGIPSTTQLTILRARILAGQRELKAAKTPAQKLVIQRKINADLSAMRMLEKRSKSVDRAAARTPATSTSRVAARTASAPPPFRAPPRVKPPTRGIGQFVRQAARPRLILPPHAAPQPAVAGAVLLQLHKRLPKNAGEHQQAYAHRLRQYAKRSLARTVLAQKATPSASTEMIAKAAVEQTILLDASALEAEIQLGTQPSDPIADSFESALSMVEPEFDMYASSAREATPEEVMIAQEAEAASSIYDEEAAREVVSQTDNSELDLDLVDPDDVEALQTAEDVALVAPYRKYGFALVAVVCAGLLWTKRKEFGF